MESEIKASFSVRKSELYRANYFVKKHNLRYTMNPMMYSEDKYGLYVEGTVKDFMEFETDMAESAKLDEPPVKKKESLLSKLKFWKKGK